MTIRRDTARTRVPREAALGMLNYRNRKRAQGEA